MKPSILRFHFLVLTVIVTAYAVSVDGLSCYTCISASGSDPNCETNPRSTPLRPCLPTFRYCHILTTRAGKFISTARNWLRWNELLTGSATTTERGCVIRPAYSNGTHQFSATTVSYQSCEQDRCNSSPATYAGLLLYIILTFKFLILLLSILGMHAFILLMIGAVAISC